MLDHAALTRKYDVIGVVHVKRCGHIGLEVQVPNWSDAVGVASEDAFRFTSSQLPADDCFVVGRGEEVGLVEDDGVDLVAGGGVEVFRSLKIFIQFLGISVKLESNFLKFNFFRFDSISF